MGNPFRDFRHLLSGLCRQRPNEEYERGPECQELGEREAESNRYTRNLMRASGFMRSEIMIRVAAAAENACIKGGIEDIDNNLLARVAGWIHLLDFEIVVIFVEREFDESVRKRGGAGVTLFNEARDDLVVLAATFETDFDLFTGRYESEEWPIHLYPEVASNVFEINRHYFTFFHNFDIL